MPPCTFSIFMMSLFHLLHLGTNFLFINLFFIPHGMHSNHTRETRSHFFLGGGRVRAGGTGKLNSRFIRNMDTMIVLISLTKENIMPIRHANYMRPSPPPNFVFLLKLTSWLNCCDTIIWKPLSSICIQFPVK